MLYFIPTPIGNLKDISKRSLELLSQIQTFFCEDTRVTKQLLTLLGKEYNLEFKDKTFISLHSWNEDRVIESLDLTIFEKECAYLSDAGMPSISDPGAKLVKFCQENSILYEVLPGANAALLAYASSGFLNSRFIFYGFLPTKEKALQNELEEILSNKYPTIIYEAPHRILKTLTLLSNLAPLREVFLLKEATKKFHKHFFGTTLEVKKELENSNLKGEWALVIKETKEESSTSNIKVEDIMELNLPPKEKAKLLSKLTKIPTKQWYNELQTTPLK
ncbi:MAG: 16S rRNA (cytidine(1402)-2'-O)-methyltransferase [Campylobacterales bacterium]|nr:16S rRNA (cytidine(1402)-2'-O)-methyltransferase [Campylobacterales bacterium]NLN00110.1 16S rRNA (cytidine(1402)-2'-O)-methyltransferase [Campylobacteraceae bacterium]